MVNLNRVVLTGNLTRDPETRELPNGSSVTSLRIAVNTRRKSGEDGWQDFANFFDVSVWGAQGENVQRFLQKGRPVGIDGRLEYREWEKDGQKRSAVQIVAENVQFLGSRNGDSDSTDDDLPPF